MSGESDVPTPPPPPQSESPKLSPNYRMESDHTLRRNNRTLSALLGAAETSNTNIATTSIDESSPLDEATVATAESSIFTSQSNSVSAAHSSATKVSNDGSNIEETKVEDGNAVTPSAGDTPMTPPVARMPPTSPSISPSTSGTARKPARSSYRERMARKRLQRNSTASTAASSTSSAEFAPLSNLRSVSDGAASDIPSSSTIVAASAMRPPTPVEGNITTNLATAQTAESISHFQRRAQRRRNKSQQVASNNTPASAQHERQVSLDSLDLHNSAPTILLEPGMEDGSITIDLADALVGQTIRSVDDRHLTHVGAIPVFLAHVSTEQNHNSMGALSYGSGDVPPIVESPNQEDEEDNDDEEAAAVPTRDDEEGASRHITIQLPEGHQNSYEEDPNVPGDRPGAFPARGRAFGDMPVWARGDRASNAANDRVGSLLNVAQWITRSRRVGSRASSWESNRSNRSHRSGNTSSSDNRLAEANLVHDAHPVVCASEVSPDQTKQIRRRFLFTFAILTLIICGLIIGLSMALTSRNRNHANDATLEPTGDYRCRLPFEEQDAFAHCACYNTTAGLNLTEDETAQYDIINVLLYAANLTQRVYNISDCDIENQVLVFNANYRHIGVTLEEVEFVSMDVLVQRFVMILLYINMDGPSWNDQEGWLQNRFACNWYGVSCSSLERISELRLPNNGLKGSLPTQLGEMPFLRVLDMSGNEIVGQLPDNLASNPVLHEIDVSNNFLSGTIPVALLDSIVIDRLVFSSNAFTGTIPTEIGRFQRMRRLSLDSNSIQGTIPSEVGNLTSLENLDLANNRLTGTIPTELSALEFMERINLGNNNLNGTIPEALGRLPRLETLYLYHNQITGPVPVDFCQGATRGFTLLIASCVSDSNATINPSCRCCDELVECFENLPTSLQMEIIGEGNNLTRRLLSNGDSIV